MKSTIRSINWILVTQFGFDLKKLIKGIVLTPRYLKEWVLFRKQFTGQMDIKPCLHDRDDEAGRTKSDYFLQDLLVAREIYKTNPLKHVDIGSRIDGFVAHVASYRDCEVFDIRSITNKVPGVNFIKADLMSDELFAVCKEHDYCDSLSCLHAIEHFGLGRYGDSLSANGYKDGIKNMARLLSVEGIMYLSTPIGRERVEFNANWIFNPKTIVDICESSGLVLEKLLVLNGNGAVEEFSPNTDSFKALELREYALGIFFFKKIKTI